MAAPPTTVAGGRTLIAGRYRLLEPIGHGGMGRVYRAHDELLGRDVALKLLDAGRSGDAALAEARAAGGLDHPNIARVFDADIDAGESFIVMELVAGRSLRNILDEQQRLPPIAAVELATPIADALDYAHRRRVVHCDVKPDNIVVTPDGSPKLIDFGIARAISTTRGTSPTEVRGSAPYIAPEQVRGDPIDGRADVYAAGAVLYELLVGRPPFVGRSLVAVISQRLVVNPPSPRSLAPAISPALDRAVMTALAREPSDRFASAGEFRDALRRAVDPASGSGIPIGRARPGARAIQTIARVTEGARALLLAMAAGLAIGLLLALAGPGSGPESADLPPVPTTARPTVPPPTTVPTSPPPSLPPVVPAAEPTTVAAPTAKPASDIAPAAEPDPAATKPESPPSPVPPAPAPPPAAPPPPAGTIQSAPPRQQAPDSRRAVRGRDGGDDDAKRDKDPKKPKPKRGRDD